MSDILRDNHCDLVTSPGRVNSKSLDTLSQANAAFPGGGDLSCNIRSRFSSLMPRSPLTALTEISDVRKVCRCCVHAVVGGQVILPSLRYLIKRAEHSATTDQTL